MNIKISIRDAPVLVNNRQLSDVENKKKMSLYRQPTGGQKEVKQDKRQMQNAKQALSKQEMKMIEAEQRLVADLTKMSKNQPKQDSLHNTQKVLQKQNQILESNQRAIERMLRPDSQSKKGESVLQMKRTAQNVARSVEQIKKIRDEIVQAWKDFNKQLNDTRGKPQANKIAVNVAELNGNLKAIAEASEARLDGLKDLEGLKGIQNLNVEAYAQAIKSLRKQISEYQKQSEEIERELRLRASKLKQLEIAPNFEQKLLEPYQQNLKKRVDSIDMHALRERVYDKLGYFDYSQFQQETNEIINQVKDQMANFTIICKTYQILVPQGRIDLKELKKLEYQQTSVLDQYKAAKNINFEQLRTANNPAAQLEAASPSDISQRQTKTAAINERIHGRKVPKAIQEMKSQPNDYATNVKLTKIQDGKRTVLQSEKNREGQQLHKKNIKYEKDSRTQDFDKYLEARKNEQLEQLFRDKKAKLQKMQRELREECEMEVPKKTISIPQPNSRRVQPQGFAQQREEVIEDRQKEIPREVIPKKPVSQQQNTIKQIGTELLREKLKNIFKKEETGALTQVRAPQPPQQINQFSGENIAQNFISLINNTLTQVNAQIANTIQNKIEKKSNSRDRPLYERVSPPKITIPKLEEIGLPPAFPLFNAYANQPPQEMGFARTSPQKIKPQTYDHLRIKDEDEYEGDQFQNLEVSYDQ